MTNDSPSKKKTSNEKKPVILKTLKDNLPLITGITVPFGILALALYGLGSSTYTLILAAVLAYLTRPITRKIALKGIPAKSIHLGFTCLIMLIIAIFLLIEVPHTIKQLTSFLAALPANLLIFINFLKDLIVSYGVHPDFIQSELTEHLSEIILRAQNAIYTTSSHLVSLTATQVNNIITLSINILLFPLVYYSLLSHHRKILDTLYNWTPQPAIPFWTLIFDAGDRVLSGYLRGQGLIMLILATVYSICLNFLQIPFATLIGVLTGILTIIPYVGFILGLTISLIMAATVDASAAKLFTVIGMFITVGVLESVFLVPQLIGHHLGIHPVIALLAIMIGGNTFGIPGFILAVPMCALVSQILIESKALISQWLDLPRRPTKTPTP